MNSKRLLAKLPLLGLGIGIALLFFPEAEGASHQHLIHLLLAGVPLLALLLLLLGRSRSSYVSRRYTLFALSVLFFFVFHLLPSTLQFTYHHQAQSSHMDHPCCSTQIATSVSVISIYMVETALEQTKLAIPSSHSFISPYSTNNKSPPRPLV